MFYVCLCMCDGSVCVWPPSLSRGYWPLLSLRAREALIKEVPVVHRLTMEGRDCLSTQWPMQKLPPPLPEWKSLIQKAMNAQTKQKLFKRLSLCYLISPGTALLWINLFQWRREKEIKSWHLKGCCWDLWPSGSIARYLTTFLAY